METPEEAMGSSSTTSNGVGECTHGTAAVVVKGKRTKRQRIHPPALAATDSSSASSADAWGSVTEEEEDMANCLILLAQGHALDACGPKAESPAEDQKFTSRRLTEAATATSGKAGFYVYECKTCNKCFPSFQALGGHRTSHKKPKMAVVAPAAEEKKAMVDEDMLQISMNSFSKAIASSIKPRVHGCSICGSEFNSGQALGGHMRRHRPLVIPEVPEAKKERTILSLDLNLPAPSDDERAELQRPPSPAFSFPSKRPLIFSASASALVDCRY
ncbi:zinc finger protein ZAT5-like [Phoenix dactylifera]|uniref:Zinc finger protein ZAT5-like n=1 Tax=Phoenix dactylifera TaxID=42345 RepID=A0A8B7CKR9_PHODC|nr:zinc finger protein ZAT5-like [Phoenix dactylifera]